MIVFSFRKHSLHLPLVELQCLDGEDAKTNILIAPQSQGFIFSREIKLKMAYSFGLLILSLHDKLGAHPQKQHISPLNVTH